MGTTVRRLSSEEVLALTPATFSIAPIFDRLSAYGGMQGAVLVAEVEGRTAGCVALVFGAEARDAGALHIDHFVVSSAYRGHGVGSALMKAVLAEARRFHAGSVRAQIPGWCPEWRGFYSRYGFVFLEGVAGSAASEMIAVELTLGDSDGSA